MTSVCRGALLLGALFASCPVAFALDPALTISQYAHTAWRSRDGFTEGVIQAIAQTDDGYLWLGTTLGLLRFDGVRVTPWHPVSGQLPSPHISTLLSARDGTLWIGTARGLASLKDGTLIQYPERGRLANPPARRGSRRCPVGCSIRCSDRQAVRHPHWSCRVLRRRWQFRQGTLWPAPRPHEPHLGRRPGGCVAMDTGSAAILFTARRAHRHPGRSSTTRTARSSSSTRAGIRRLENGQDWTAGFLS